MKSKFVSNKNGVRQLNWIRIALFSSIAPVCVAVPLLAWIAMSGRQPWPLNEVAFWMIALISWTAFAGGLAHASEASEDNMVDKI